MGAYARFADLLEYPDHTLAGRLETSAALMATAGGAVRDAFARFRDDVQRRDLETIQELYTSAFDLDARATLYAGHHVFGESSRRSVFMARLAQDYRESGFERPEHELPDHLPAMLRFVDRQWSGGASGPSDRQTPEPAHRVGSERSEVQRELITEILEPAVRRIVQALEASNNPYRFVMEALLAQIKAQL